MTLYNYPYIFQKCQGNNALSYEKRKKLLGKNPEIFIPSRKIGNIDEVIISENIVFEEVEKNRLISCRGLENFIEIPSEKFPETVIFDNHNHALFFWCEAVKNGVLSPGFTLIHMDEHSDLWENSHDFSLEEIMNLEKMWEFTNFSCHVGNYILPAMRAGLVNNIIRLENEFQIDAAFGKNFPKNSVFNLDLDIFSPELSHIPKEKILACIHYIIPRVSYITIATSPYFINQDTAIERLYEIFKA